MLHSAKSSSPGSTSHRLALNFVARCACLFIRHSIRFSTKPPRGRCNDGCLLPANVIVSITSSSTLLSPSFRRPFIRPSILIPTNTTPMTGGCPNSGLLASLQRKIEQQDLRIAAMYPLFLYPLPLSPSSPFSSLPQYIILQRIT